ncbi:hypothetical protein [Algoriphagus machipongonensis]|nr:hypothetical protein [Algoriphagus machipongonensis]
MKKYLFIIGLGAMIFNSSCDSQNEDSIFAMDQMAADADSNDNLNARIGPSAGGKGEGNAKFNYEIAEYSYDGIMMTLPAEKAKEIMETSRTKEDFIGKMIVKSIGIFDSTLVKRATMFSDYARRNHAALAGDEHEIEYDIAAGPYASAAAFMKIGDIKGESRDKEYPFALLFDNNRPQAAPSTGPWDDSIPPVKKPELESMAEFVLQLNSRTAEPASIAESLDELEIGYGVDPAAIAMLLPAIQKVREAASTGTNARGKADILIESLSLNYGLDKEGDFASLLQLGGMGSIGKLASDDYDSSGDVDWASIQLNRKKFEFEMFYLWDRFWENHQELPVPGR